MERFFVPLVQRTTAANMSANNALRLLLGEPRNVCKGFLRHLAVEALATITALGRTYSPATTDRLLPGPPRPICDGWFELEQDAARGWHPISRMTSTTRSVLSPRNAASLERLGLPNTSSRSALRCGSSKASPTSHTSTTTTMPKSCML